MNRAITTLTAALLGAATAQEIATSLPLTSVGQKLMWTVGDQDLKLVVGVSSRVQLDLYGAQFDPQDYRKPDQFGDENYSTERPKAPVSTDFTLTDAGGKVVKTFNYGAGAQEWQTFINEDLPAGTYTLKIRTEGNGKNTFAFRLNSISAAVQAEHLNVTVRSNDWVPALNVYNPGGAGMVVRMYDGDGPQELEAELRDAQGNAYPIKVSGQLQWDNIDVPEGKGNYAVYLRQPQKTYQWSNTVGFELAGGPITVVQADTTGKLDIKAELILPDEVLPTQATVTACGNTYEVNGQAGPFTLPEQNCDVAVQPIKGAEVTLDKTQATIVKQQTEHLKVEVRPSVALSFQADKPEVCVGDVVKFTAQAITDFERQPLPASLQVKLPAGFTANGETTATAKIDANNPNVLTFEAKATEAGGGDAVATLLPWNKQESLGVKVLPTATQIELRRAELPATLPGETVTVSLTLTNTSKVAAPYTLVDTPGETLEALDTTSFTGELAPGETKTLTYTARVKGEAGTAGKLEATLSSSCDSKQTLAGTLTVQTPPPPPVTPVVAVSRESVVRIPFDSPRSATQIVVAHSAPEGSRYVPGSSALNGKVIADPQVGQSGKFYWTTPGLQRGVLTYRVVHEGALPALQSPTLIGKYARNTFEVLVGDGKLEEVQSLQTIQTEVEKENDGVLKLPMDGQVYRTRDRITVAVESSVGDQTLPTVNGVPVDAKTLGKTVTDPNRNVERREFFGLPLQAGENTVAFGGKISKVYLATTPVNAQFTPEQLVADGFTPIRIAVKLVDAHGLTNGTSVTIQSTREVTQSDAKPTVGSYQVKLEDGVGVLELEPMSTPGRFTVRALVGEKVVSHEFESVPSKTRVGIGMVSAGVLLGGAGIGSGSAGVAGEIRGAGYLETPIGDGKLYVAGAAAATAEQDSRGTLKIAQDRQQGLPTTANPLERYPTYGDSSTHEIPLQGIDPLAFRYEHPKFNVQYRQASLPVDVFDTGIAPTALSGFTRTNPQVSGFVAMVPDGRVQRTYDASGQRVLPLGLTRGTVQPDSEVVEIVTVDRLTGAVTYRPLQRLSDYTIDNVAGVLYFQRPINLTDDDGNSQQVRVTYRLDDPIDARKLAWGVQVGTRLMEDRLTLAAGAVQLDNVLSFGARARYLDDRSRADLLAATTSQGGVMVSGSASLTTERLTASASIKYQTPEYKGLNSVEVGTAVKAEATYKLTDRFGVGVSGLYRQRPDPAHPGEFTENGGYADVKGTYSFAPFTVGAGVRAGFGDMAGFGLVGLVGYDHKGFNVKVEHAQTISGDLPSTTTVSATAPLRENVSLTARDVVRWGVDQRASVGLQARLGMTNLSVNYDLPGADGWGNRARFGVDTTLPVNDRVTVGLNGSYILDVAGDDDGWNAGASVRYKDERLTATLAGDVSQKKDGLRFSVKGGASYSLNDRLTLSADGTHVRGPQPSDTGNNFAVSAALRASQWQGLAYLRYKDGSLGGLNPEVIGEGNLEYHVPQFALRGGIAGRMLLNQPESLTYQLSASGTYYVTDRLGLGLAARALMQPASGTTLYSAGIEGSFRALPGTWVTLGYNPVGFSGIGSNLYTRQGAYLRLDLMLDDAQPNGANAQPSVQDQASPLNPGEVGWQPPALDASGQPIELNLQPTLPTCPAPEKK